MRRDSHDRADLDCFPLVALAGPLSQVEGVAPETETFAQRTAASRMMMVSCSCEGEE